jgi:Pectinacetylesterase
MRDLFLVAIACAAGCNESAATAPMQHPSSPEVHSPFVPVSPYAPGQPDPGNPDPSVPVCDQRAFPGAPIATPANQWTWVDFPEALCRDGSSTGIGVRLNPASKKVAIYLEGGGACFHGDSCLINDVFLNFGATQFGVWAAATGSAGIFDSSRADNPFRDWNLIYVPYCTGDVHAGNKEHVDVPGGPADQMFVGWRNIGLYLERLVPTFADATDVVLTGISAGGVGAAFNYDRVGAAFCRSRVTLLDDSGPVMSDQYLAPCLQERWRELWNLDATLPPDCPSCRGANGGGMVNYLPYLTAKHPNDRMGIISANRDGIISLFFGYGANNCQGLSGFSAGMSGDTFEAGLLDVRSRYILPSKNWGSYLIDSTSHTWITALTFYNTTVSGVPLPQWVDQLVNHQSLSNVAP